MHWNCTNLISSLLNELVYYLDYSRKGDDEASPAKKVKSEDSQENTGMLTSVFFNVF